MHEIGGFSSYFEKDINWREFLYPKGTITEGTPHFLFAKLIGKFVLAQNARRPSDDLLQNLNICD
jgi:hypothetical protein